MLTFFICLFTLGALHGGSAGNTSCLLEQIPYMQRDFLRTTDGICRDFKKIKIGEIRINIKKCPFQELFDIDGYESMVTELCDNNSDFQNKYLKTLPCTQKGFDKSERCWDSTSYPELMTLEYHKDENYAKEICTNTAEKMFKCMFKYMENCGEEAVHVTERLSKYAKLSNIIQCLGVHRCIDGKEETECSNVPLSVANFLFSWLMFGFLTATNWYLL